ncbi:MAG: hypothetical protein DWP98_05495 [Bacteroidetes bacterium]|nr:MAG: hypothetical protein DWP98_05495 [Bacteroidota bacterium]
MLFGQELQAQFYNGTQTDFGKNRVQYDDFEWQFYRFQNFETYFYTGGKELAVHTAKLASQRIGAIEKFLDFYNDERIQFVIYNKQSHFRQSNIGLASNESYNIGGVTNIVGSKVFIYFEGDYEKFNQQIEAGIYKVMIYQMIYGGNWRELLRNSALLHLPDWYISGLVSYLSNPNNALINSQIKDGIINDKFKKFNALNTRDSEIAGHAMWKYIADSYGKNVISNILYMTRISRNIEDGFLYVLGVSFEDLYTNWLNHYQNAYNTENQNNKLNTGEPLDLKIRKDRVYQNFKINNENNLAVFNTNKLGQYKVYVYDFETRKKKRIFKGDHKLERIQDYSYPITAWHPNGKIVSFIIEKKGLVLLYSYNTEDESMYHKPIFKIEKVLSFEYAPNGKEIIFSAVANGQSDIFTYNIMGNTQKNLTNDIYDDLEPTYINSNEIIFTSNRRNDSLNLDHQKSSFESDKDIFLYRLNSSKPIQAITNSRDQDEFMPLVFQDGIYFHTNKGGKIYRYSAAFDSSVSHIDTTVHYNYFYNLNELGTSEWNDLEINTNKRSNTFSQINYHSGKYHLNYGTSFTKEESESDLSSSIPASTENKSQTQISPEAIRLKKIKPITVEKDINIFDFKFTGTNPSIQKTKEKVEQIDNRIADIELDFPTQRIYRLNFRPDNSIIQLNNSFANGQYQLYNGGPFTNPGVGINTKIGIVDLMEDHRVYGGFRLGGSMSEYSLNYQNLKRRMDKEYSFTRRKQRSTNTPIPFDIKTLQASVSLIWPFSEITSLRTTFQARNDKIVLLASDRFALEAPTSNEYWAAIKAAYIFDNTRDVSLNIKYGTRFKIYAEQYQLAYSEVETNSSDLSVVGFDARHYQKLHKEIIYVGRIAGSKSFGTNPLVYYLGGVDEWWKSDLFDESTPIDNTQNYGFQALAANMRGFLQNIRNGNNFVVINNEIRIPIFSYLINRPIQSDFVRNFQIIGFGDIGTAWIGSSPFSDDNPINNESKTTGSITVTYENINDPIVGGFGTGVRTKLLGYFARFDCAWGVENGVITDKPMFIFSLSLDI